MANKQYLSPIRLFNHSEISFDGDINLPRIKKQLVAEFDFTPSGLIETGGYVYSKSDLLEELNTPEFESRLYYHKMIFNRKALLAVLEDNRLDMPALEEDLRKFANEVPFEEFISPYFAVSFNIIARNFLHGSRLADMADWLRCEDYLKPADREEGFRSLRIFFEENIRLLKNTGAENFGNNRAAIKHWLQPGFASFLNYLPVEFFDEKNDIVTHLVNLTVRIQKKYKYECREISTELTCIREISPDLSEIIMSNHQAYSGQKTISTGSGNYWWVLWVSLLLIRILIKC